MISNKILLICLAFIALTACSAGSKKQTNHHMENENYGVEDLQSANGMKINGYSIQTGMVYELPEGDVITLTDDSFTVSYVITPDFLCLSKGLTNGLPLAVVLGPKNEILSMSILDILLITGTCLF